jgi:type III pantothenate kinase
MTDLFIDSGNSRIKLARYSSAGFDYLPALDFEDVEINERFKAALTDLEFERIVLAAVSKGRRSQQLADLLVNTGKPIIQITTKASMGRLQVAYPAPSQLGVDRFLAMLAVSDAAEPCILISFGSALTVDVLDADGRHRGGVIAPSPDFQRRSMMSAFPGLFEEEGQIRSLADNTPDALTSGIAHQTLGLIERILGTVDASEDWRLWVSGGAALHWLPLLPSNARHAPDILFRGMQRYMELDSA